MDSILSAALEEICVEGVKGIPLRKLWPRLQVSLASSGLHPCEAVKEAIWRRLLIHPGIKFVVEGSSLGSQDPSIQSFEESEKLGLKIVAEEHLRDSFLGLCDLKAANSEIPQLQRGVLERLAAARTAGITQNNLAKELGLKGNDMFYHVRNLECQRLVVRQSTVVRTKQSGTEGEYENKTSHHVTTNLIHLYRFAKHLNSNSQQKLEITKPGLGESLGDADGSLLTQDDASGECMQEDVRVKDYLPAMKAVCDKLEEASGKVLAVQDIKQTLGYRKTQGHRAWRNIRNRLKEANLVEEVQAKENKKNVRCLRLQKKFDPKDFLPKPVLCGYDDFDSEQPVKCGTRGQITDQLVELPIDHLIYDIIDAEGPKGITYSEVCKRLGLNGKKNYARIVDMRSRFGICMHAEIQNRTKLYRLWTPRNFKDYSFTAFPGNCGEGPAISSWSLKDLVPCEQSSSNFLQLDSSSKNEVLHYKRVGTAPMGLTSSIDCSGHLDDGTVVPGTGQQECAPVIVSIDHDSKHKGMEASDSASPCPVSTLKLPSSQRYPRLPTTVVSDQRQERILTRLKNEKFILMVELHKWLEGLEKDKGTTMDRKTLTRSVNKLQEKGQCKCVQVSFPNLTHYSRTRTVEVILHPSIESLSSELSVEIRERQRYFDMQNRGRGSAKSKNDERLAVVLEDVKRHPHHGVSNDQISNAEPMRANGFVSAKMVRTKLFHKFLWCYISSMPDWHLSLSSEKHGYDLKNPQSTLKLFPFDSAILAMPLELFLQVVGSAKSVDNLVENCRRGLCLSDLSVQEYKCLLDDPAKGRLSCIIDVLSRLKLIQLVDEGPAVDVNVLAHVTLRHALELKPYIEAPRARPSFGRKSSDFRPRIRHDFIFFNSEAVDAYWQTLEYCYATAVPSAASHAFPGSAVREVFFLRSWASVRVMTAEQHTELLKSVANDDPKEKLLLKDCVKIATELNLTLEQVLRASYDKHRSRRNRCSQYIKPKEQENHLDETASIARKRKRSSKNRLPDHAPNDTKDGDLSRPIMPNKSDSDELCMKPSSCSLTTVDDSDNHLQPFEDESILNAERVPYEGGGEKCDPIHQYAFSKLKPKRRRKFPWTDDLDRQLVIQYARYRAMLGARFFRVDWASISDLPTLPDTCRRRLPVLMDNSNIREAVLRLSNLLGERYAQYHSKRNFKDSEKIILNHPSGGSPQNSKVHEFTFGSNLQGGLWDDFEDLQIKMAVEEVLRCKRMAEHESSSRVESRNEKEWTDILPPDGEKSDVFNPLEKQISVSLLTAGGEIPGPSERHKKYSGLVTFTRRSRSRPHCLQGKALKIWNNRGISIKRQVHESLAVSSAVELLKLVFLSTSAVPEVQALLAETLKQYSERELFAAFNYLRDKNFMVLGLGCKPFVLSQQFWRSASSSPFPIDSGKRVANFATWLHEQEADLMVDGINLSADLQCGEIFHLFALVSSGELLISPCLPNEGIGEADELKNLDCGIDDNIKKQIPQWKISNDYCNRGDKGFPGIKILLSRATVSRAEILDSNKEKYTCFLQFDKNYPVNFLTLSTEDTPLQRDSCHNFRNSGLSNVSPNGSFWEAVASCAELMSSTNIGKKQKTKYSADLIKSVYTSIQQAGEQGLKMEEISQDVIQGEGWAEIFVDSLEVFQLVMKVNAYDCVRAVDSLYRSKYFITTLSGQSEDLKPSFSFMKSQKMNLETSQRLLPEKQRSVVPGSWDETDMNICRGHKVTLLDLPEASPSESFFGTQPTEEEGVSFQDHTQTKAFLDQGNREETTTKYSDLNGPAMSRPLLPWMNGDGSTNTTVYKGLVRRVLGMVMQNPGIMEEDLINRMDVLNPQSCKQLLELMALDNHIMMRKMFQTTFNAPPGILQSLFRPNYRESKSMFRKHIFANPMSTPLL